MERHSEWAPPGAKEKQIQTTSLFPAHGVPVKDVPGVVFIALYTCVHKLADLQTPYQQHDF